MEVGTFCESPVSSRFDFNSTGHAQGIEINWSIKGKFQNNYQKFHGFLEWQYLISIFTFSMKRAKTFICKLKSYQKCQRHFY